MARPKQRLIEDLNVTWLTGEHAGTMERITSAEKSGSVPYAMDCWACGERVPAGSPRVLLNSPSAIKQFTTAYHGAATGSATDPTCEAAADALIAGVNAWHALREKAAAPKPAPKAAAPKAVPKPKAAGGMLEAAIAAAVDERVLEIVEQAIATHIPAAPTTTITIRDERTAREWAPPATAHVQFGEIMKRLTTLRRAWLVGPSGSGKTFAAAQCAEALEDAGGGRKCGFYLVSCNGASEVALQGRAMPGVPGSYIGTGVTDALDATQRGEDAVLLLDEADGLDESAALTLHPLAQRDGIYTPARAGQTHTKQGSGTLYIVLATNTFATSYGNATHNARNQLDAATRDRFKLAKIWLDYDPAVERGYMVASGLPEVIGERLWKIRATLTSDEIENVTASTRDFRDMGALHKAYPETYTEEALFGIWAMGLSDTVKAKLGVA